MMPQEYETKPPPRAPYIDPRLWESYQGFRETLLVQVSDRRANAILRGLGGLLFDLVVEQSGPGDGAPASIVRSELAAAAADLRQLEGFLAAVGEERSVVALSPADAALSRVAARQARGVARIAKTLESALSRDEESTAPP